MEKEITTQIEGKTYKGSYKIEEEMIYVYYGDKHKSTQVGGSISAPEGLEGLAELILGELVREEIREEEN